jgi:predicted Rossmann-fold nucleotide-binding protein
VGVMGSAEEAASPEISETARMLALEIGRRGLILLTGATTGIIYLIGKTAREAGAFHIGISPAPRRKRTY